MSLCLFPLLAEQLDGGGQHCGAVACTAAFKADKTLIAHLLEGTEAVAVVVLLAVLARHLATAAAGDVYVLQVFCPG